MWAKILSIILPFLYQFIVAFVGNLESAGANDPSLLESVYDIVKGIEEAHPDASGDDKWQLAFDAAAALFKQKGKEVGTSLVNTLIELAVQRLKSEAAST